MKKLIFSAAVILSIGLYSFSSMSEDNSESPQHVVGDCQCIQKTEIITGVDDLVDYDGNIIMQNGYPICAVECDPPVGPCPHPCE